VARPTPGVAAAITWSSIQKFNPRTFFWFAAEVTHGSHMTHRTHQTDETYVREVSATRRGSRGLILSMVQLHPLMALHIITKFPA
jgi:hypothetical protein